MPAPPSSRIDPAIGHLVQQAGDPAGGSRAYWKCWPGSLIPRDRWGVRHRLAVIVGLALCAMVAGARSFTAIAEWAADADERPCTGSVPRIAAALRHHARLPGRPLRTIMNC